MAQVTFDGVNRIIDVDFGVEELNVQIDLYSDWKEWILEPHEANAKFTQTFRTVAGDPIGPGKFISPYFFLLNGWVIRPHNANHQLLVEGNLYADPFVNPIATPPVGTFTVAIILERAIDAITTVVTTSGSASSGSGLTTEQAQQLEDTYIATGDTTSSLEEVITSQSFADGNFDEIITSQSFADGDLDEIVISQSIADIKLDSLLSVSGSALTPDQNDMLMKLYDVMGLDPTQPLVVTPVARTVSSSISQSITTSGDEVTVTRIP